MFEPLSISTDILTKLIDEWISLRKSKRAEELTTEEWKQLERSYMEHLKWRFQYPSTVFGQQRAISWILTFLVIALICSGLVFSFMQLNAAIKLGDLASLSTDIKVESASKLSMSSSIVGAIVLVISLLFFNLYLKHVFQIRYPTPPHVGLSDTDASKVWLRTKEKFEKDNKAANKNLYNKPVTQQNKLANSKTHR
jgi:hypothetical protein